MSFHGLLNKTCTIQRATATRSNRGRVSPTWADSSTGVKCALIALLGKDAMQAQGWGIDADYKVLLPAGTDVRPEPSDSSSGALPDRIAIDSVNYLVKRVADVSGRGKTLVVWAKRQV